MKNILVFSIGGIIGLYLSKKLILNYRGKKKKRFFSKVIGIPNYKNGYY